MRIALLIVWCVILAFIVRSAMARIRARVRPQEPSIVAAVATMAAVKRQPVTAKRIEAAMSAAVHECIARGVSLDESETIRAAMLAARERVLHERTE